MVLGEFSDHQRGTPAGMAPKPAKLGWIAGSLALCFLFLALSAVYLSYVRETIRKDAKGNLAELGNHIAQSLNSEISSTTEVLGSLALEVSRSQIHTEEGSPTIIFWTL